MWGLEVREFAVRLAEFDAKRIQLKFDTKVRRPDVF